MLNEWTTIYDIIEHGIAGDTAKCRAYTELLLDHLKKNRDLLTTQEDNMKVTRPLAIETANRRIGYIERILEGNRGSVIHLANEG